MKARVKKLADGLVGVLADWNGVQAVTLQHFAEKDIYDPNFSVSFDVFCREHIPEPEQRRNAFPDASYFEASPAGTKDRFMAGDLPVRISYKECRRIEEAVDAASGNAGALPGEQDTYLFYRLATGSELLSVEDWLAGIRSRLDQLPESFWTAWTNSSRDKLDHLLGDLGAAAIQDDALYFRLSLSGFLKAAAEFLFSVNHVFQPGPRDVTGVLSLLETLPDGFEANWQSLLRESEELPPQRKRDVAEVLARSLFALMG